MDGSRQHLARDLLLQLVPMLALQGADVVDAGVIVLQHLLKKALHPGAQIGGHAHSVCVELRLLPVGMLGAAGLDSDRPASDHPY